MSSSPQKRKKQSLTKKNTLERRKTQLCRVIELKLVPSKLSKGAKEELSSLFVQAKWLRNSVVASGNPFEFDDKVKSVPVKVGAHFEQRKLSVLGSQIKQALVSQVQSELKGLSTKKKKGEKVGRLRFKSTLSSIPLKQHQVTYTLKRKGKSKHGLLSLQKLKHTLRVRGMDQIPRYAELANAKLLKRAGDYFLHVTCFLDKEKHQKAQKHKRERQGLDKVSKRVGIGLDLGIANQVSLSNGLVLQYRVPVTKRLKKTAQKVSKTKKHSKNRRKAREKLQKEYQKATNIKEELSNQLRAVLCLCAQWICYQDDSIRGWQRVWGKRMLETSIGRLLGKIKMLPNAIEVDRYYASSQECRMCKTKRKHSLKERVYRCKECGHVENRDVHAARNIENVGLVNKVLVERQEPSHETPGDMKTSALMAELLKRIPYMKVSVVDEPGSPKNTSVFWESS